MGSASSLDGGPPPRRRGGGRHPRHPPGAGGAARPRSGHCDFKPSNVIATSDGPKLIDLGAVHRIDGTADPLRHAGGSPPPRWPTATSPRSPPTSTASAGPGRPVRSPRRGRRALRVQAPRPGRGTPVRPVRLAVPPAAASHCGRPERPIRVGRRRWPTSWRACSTSSAPERYGEAEPAISSSSPATWGTTRSGRLAAAPPVAGPTATTRRRATWPRWPAPSPTR